MCFLKESEILQILFTGSKTLLQDLTEPIQVKGLLTWIILLWAAFSTLFSKFIFSWIFWVRLMSDVANCARFGAHFGVRCISILVFTETEENTHHNTHQIGHDSRHLTSALSSKNLVRTCLRANLTQIPGLQFWVSQLFSCKIFGLGWRLLLWHSENSLIE